ncbi:MAG: ribonuclease HIII, partial [Verrucomicrobia bacterium]|nr:ribonuclease HIII [Verrucomicrobiota bacterium]
MTSYTFKLTTEQQETLSTVLRNGNYRPIRVEHTQIAVRTPDCSISLYKSGKCLVQGKGAEEFVTFVLEPLVLQQVAFGYDEVVNPEGSQPHMGVDESGKGDFFGPLVIAAAYVDPELARTMQEMGVKDSKSITSDKKAMDLGLALRRLLGKRFSTVKIGPPTYNRLYAKMRNVNTLLAWAHARAIENLLEAVPDCPMAISDQFGSTKLIERALMTKGRNIKLVQRVRAEADVAVAAASIIARDLFLRSLLDMEKSLAVKIP